MCPPSPPTFHIFKQKKSHLSANWNLSAKQMAFAMISDWSAFYEVPGPEECAEWSDNPVLQERKRCAVPILAKFPHVKWNAVPIKPRQFVPFIAFIVPIMAVMMFSPSFQICYKKSLYNSHDTSYESDRHFLFMRLLYHMVLENASTFLHQLCFFGWSL